VLTTKLIRLILLPIFSNITVDDRHPGTKPSSQKLNNVGKVCVTCRWPIEGELGNRNLYKEE
jgi:hypothetical protein